MAAEPTLTLTAAGKRVPDFFIVGAPKSGTTSLFWMLRQHPQIVHQMVVQGSARYTRYTNTLLRYDWRRSLQSRGVYRGATCEALAQLITEPRTAGEGLA